MVVLDGLVMELLAVACSHALALRILGQCCCGPEPTES